MGGEMSDQRIIITGASEGIGRELALQLSQRGARLSLAARNAAALDQLVQDCESSGGKAIAVPTDVADHAACKALIDKTAAAFGGIDVLVNNAGISMRSPVSEIEDLSIYERVMRVNYLGSVYCTHAALPHLKASKGLIVAVSSLQGKTGFPLSSGYSASKFAMQGFFDSLRIELDGSGVDVLIVFPGAVDTGIHTRKLEVDARLAKHNWKPEKNALMPVEECVRQMVRAMERRDRELLLTLQGKLIPWMRLIAPRFVDRAIARAIDKFYAT
jgi:short-subunit dehydrogenase